MFEYKLYTEDKGASVTSSYISLITPKFPGFTIQNNTGYWQGMPERSLTITIIAQFNHKAIYALAEQIRECGNQDAVLVTVTPINAGLVQRGEYVQL